MNQLLQKYKKISLPVRASLWFVIMGVLQKGIQFFITPVYTRLLTTEEYGYYSIYVTWQSIFMIIATLNLSAGVFYNGMLKYENDRRAFISSIQGLANVCTLMVLTIVLVLYKFISAIVGLDIIVIIAMFATFMLYPSFEYWSQYNRYTFNYRPLIIWTILYAIVNSGLSILFIFIIPEKKYAVVFGTIVTQLLWGIFFYIKNLKEGKVFFRKEYWQYAFRFNIALIPHYLSFIILGQADRVMIDYYCGNGKVGIYSLSYTVSLMLSIVVNAISATFAPWTFQKIKNSEENTIKRISNLVLVVMFVLILLCVLIAPELVKFLGTDEYLEALWIIPPVMLSCYFTMVYSLFANIEFYYEKSSYVMIASVIAAVSNIVLNFVFIPMYGFIAAGYTTLASYILLTFTHFLLMKKCLRKQDKSCMYDLKTIVAISIGICVISISLISTYEFIIIRYVFIGFIMTISIAFRKKIVGLLIMLRTKE